MFLIAFLRISLDGHIKTVKMEKQVENEKSCEEADMLHILFKIEFY